MRVGVSANLNEDAPRMQRYASTQDVEDVEDIYRGVGLRCIEPTTTRSNLRGPYER
jgi:hypothetical protein